MEEGNQTGTENQAGTGDDSQPAWTAQLPDDLKGHDGLTGFQTIGELGKAYLDLHGKSGGAVQLPGENATEDELKAFFDRLGRPETSEGYKFENIALPERFRGMEEQFQQDEAAFKEAAHKLGLNQSQAEGIYSWYFNRLNEADAALTKGAEDYLANAKAQLQKLWGDKAQENVELAHRAALKMGEAAGISEEFQKYLNDSGLGNDPMLIRVFAAAGRGMAEDVAGDTGLKGKAEGQEGFDRGEDGRPILKFPSMEDK